jgi:ribosomal protein S18 acetylase RimI-like enzyme
MSAITIRPAKPADRSRLRQAVVALRERALHVTRLPGEMVADAYLDWLQRQAEIGAGAMLVAESDGAFAAFGVGWIEVADIITETPDSNRFGYVSDLCVMPAFRGRRIAEQLLSSIEQHFRQAGVVRIRINALAANRSARVSYERAGYAPYEVLHEKVLEPEPRATSALDASIREPK